MIGGEQRALHRRADDADVEPEQPCDETVIGVRKAGQLLVGGEGQFVEVEDAVAAGIDVKLAVFAAIDQVADFLQRLAIGQFEQGAFALADDQVVDLGKMFDDGRPERGYMDIAEDDPDLRTTFANIGGDLDAIHESGGGR